jgi:AsmA-like protein
LRRLLIVLTVLVLLTLAALIAIRSKLNAETLRAAAETRLTAMLGQPVRIGEIGISFFPVAATGSRIAIGTNSETPDLALERIRIIPQVSSLFRGPYVIREVTLDGLDIRIARESTGRWRFPSVVPAAGGGGSGVTVERVRLSRGRVRVFGMDGRNGVRQTSSIDAIEGESITLVDGLRVSPLTGRVGRSLVNGSASVNAREAVLDFSMPSIAPSDLAAVIGLSAAEAPDAVRLIKPAAVKMSVRINRANGRLTGSGSLAAQQVGFYSLQLNNLESPIATNGAQITFDPATFTLYRGTHRGRMVIDLARTPARWTSESSVKDIDASDFLAALTGREQRLDGTAAATSALHAPVGSPMPQSLEGRLQLNVVNGVVREFPMLTAINRALRLAESSGRDTQFERLSGTFVLTGTDAASTNDLLMIARDMRVRATGRIGFDRWLDLDGMAVFSPDRTAEAIRSVRELSALRNEQGELELPIHIGGTLDDPSFNIDLEAALARSIKDELQRRLRRLFHR